MEPLIILILLLVWCGPAWARRIGRGHTFVHAGVIGVVLRSVGTFAVMFVVGFGIGGVPGLSLWTQVAAAGAPAPKETPPLAALSAPIVDQSQADLGRQLFFDTRLSGDDQVSCATCHRPDRGWADGLPLSAGYTGTAYFRNAPTVMNAGRLDHFYWDGRVAGDDLNAVILDHLREAHFMQADGRLVVERLRQVPFYVQSFRDVAGEGPELGSIVEAIAAFVHQLQSRAAPIDRYLGGDTNALSESAVRGLELFRNRAGCLRCHHGPMFSDGAYHNLGLPQTGGIFRDPMRHITFRRYLRMHDMDPLTATDPGRFAVTGNDNDQRRFRTPTLREISRTAPYMHDGSLATLMDVIEFYDAGGGSASGISEPSLEPLGLSEQEKQDLVEFLLSLAGTPVTIDEPERPAYELDRPEGH